MEDGGEHIARIGILTGGRGLLLGGGNAIATNGNASVFATLICEATPPFTQFSTNIAGVPLAANGDFEIDDVLAPAPPAQCGSPVLLIRVTPSGAWFCCGHPEGLVPIKDGHIKGSRFCRQGTQSLNFTIHTPLRSRKDEDDG